MLTGVDELSFFLYVVDPAHDTTIRAAHGALLTIPAGAVAKAITGPPLAFVADREPDRKWLHDFIINNFKVLSRGK